MNWLLQENIHREVELLRFDFSKPDLLEIENNWGVATESVFDFLNRDVIIKKKI
jgi:hypothetical protein